MIRTHLLRCATCAGLTLLAALPASAQIGRTFPSERKVVKDPVTGVELTFVTSQAGQGDAKIYQTHNQWTADGNWMIFRSNRARGEAMAVNEKTGQLVQVTEGGYSGMLCVADNSMNLYFLRTPRPLTPPGEAAAPAQPPAQPAPAAQPAAEAAQAPAQPAEGAGAAGGDGRRGGRGRRGGGGGGGRGRGPQVPVQIVRVDLARLFADVAAGKVSGPDTYQHVCGTIPIEFGGDNMALDPTEEFAYFRTSSQIAAQHLPADAKVEEPFGPRGMGAGPNGLASMNLKTGEVKFLVAVPFQIGHVQTNPRTPGEIVFCWETGGKAPQRTWYVKSDGTGLRPMYPEASYEWVTHEAVTGKDEVAIAILSHRRINIADPAIEGPGQEADWGNSGTGERPSGLGMVNLRTREMRIVGQVPVGDPGRSVWHVHASADGRWAVADDFQYRLWIVDRKNGEMALLADLGHKTRASDHIHPTFNADGTKIQVQTAMLSEDGTSLNICVVPVPKSWLNRTYTQKLE